MTRFRPGQRVTVNPNIYCGHCEYCLAGQLVRCANTEGMGVHRPGFFAEYASADHRQVFPVDGLEPDTAVFCEPPPARCMGWKLLIYVRVAALWFLVPARRACCWLS